MAITLDARKVDQALQTRLGGGLARAILPEVLEALQAYTPRQTDLVQLTDAVDKAIFAALYRLLGKRLTYRRSDGRVDVIHTAELAAITDACMGVLLQTLHATPANFAVVRDYAMRSGSLAAFRLLTTGYADYLNEGDLALIQRILTERT